MSQKILIATHNKGKFIEICEVLDHKLPFEFVSLNDLNINEDVEESGETYAENAKIKSEFFHKLSRLPTIADDSGIHVDALDKELGVKTRRWGAGPDASDDEWIDYFMNRMSQETNRKAEFICNAAFTHKGETQTVEGITHGVIVEKLEAEYLPGLPLSAVFKPNGCEHVYSALSIEEKNHISHRGKALKKLLDKYLLFYPKI